jgi:integrase
MAREINRLSHDDARGKNERTRGPGRYSDGAGLYLYVSPAGNRSWVFRYRDHVTGKLRDKGLGPTHDVTLAQARKAASKCREMVRDGADPISDKRQRQEAAKAEHAKRKTFGFCVERFIASHEPSWRSGKHGKQWRSTLGTYAADLMPLAVSEVDTGLVLGALEPIWTTKTETATRIRQRLESVLDWATARGYRKGENPARWRGHLDKLLPAPTKLRTVQHQPAMRYAEVGAYMARLRESDALSAKALRLQILTAARPNEACAAEWQEFDLDAACWTIPPNRTKTHREHRVPLSPELVTMLRGMHEAGARFVFPGKPKRPITTAATLKLLQDTHPNLTCHGFRSTFRVWASEQTNFANEVVEAALAHTIKNKAEAAYARSDLYDKRARLMKEWERYCSRAPAKEGNVTPINAERKSTAK